jgi:hypothetical protein
MWRKPYRRPKPPPDPTPPSAVLEMMADEFEAKEYLGASSGAMIVSHPPQPASEPATGWRPPPPPWSEAYTGDEPEPLEVDEAEPTQEPEPLPRVEIPKPDWPANFGVGEDEQTDSVSEKDEQ